MTEAATPDNGSSTEAQTDRDRPTTSRRRPLRWRRLALVALGTYLLVCVLITALQSKLIYFPMRGYPITPADVGLAFEDLRLETADGVRIAAWYVAHSDARGSVIFHHGNAGNMSDRLHSLQVLHRMRLNVLMYDYRGYGASEGSPSEEGTYLDADAVWNYLTETRGEPVERIVSFGRSLGGAVAIESARRHPPAALVVESSFTSLEDIGRLHYRLLPVRWMLTYRYDSIRKVGDITCPKLFLHGTEDTLIPIDNGRALFDAAAEPKQFIETPGGHNDAGMTFSPAYSERVAAYFDEVL